MLNQSDDELLKEINSFLGEVAGLESDFPADSLLFSTGLLDSLISIKLIMFLDEKFGVRVSPLSVSLDDFDSVQKIVETAKKFS